MKDQKIFNFVIFTFIVFCLVCIVPISAWAHGEGTTIVPETLTVKAGSELKVTVNGLVGTKTATFKLTGITGQYELGKFPISSDDFSQVLQIPPDISPGSYLLTVEGGGKSAKVVISIN